MEHVEVEKTYHLELDLAIESLDILREQIECLLNRIQGTTSGENSKEEIRPPVALAVVLFGGSKRVRDYHEKCSKLIEKIEEVLFKSNQ